MLIISVALVSFLSIWKPFGVSIPLLKRIIIKSASSEFVSDVLFIFSDILLHFYSHMIVFLDPSFSKFSIKDFKMDPGGGTSISR